MLNLETIGRKIALERKSKGLTQNELAETLYVTHQAVSKWENGKSIPSIEILLELTTLFDVTIDYLLDNSELVSNDYAQMYKQFSRKVVLSKFLNSEDPNSNVENIFYLLNPGERKFVINKIISNHSTIDTEVIWPYLNNDERKLFLSVILSNKFDYDVSHIYQFLNNEERILCMIQSKDGSYKYPVSHTHYNIRSD